MKSSNRGQDRVEGSDRKQEQSDRDPLHWALIELCWERGFDAVDVEMLCRRAGIDRADFERRYSDLEDCFCAAYGVERERIMGYLFEACEGIDDWRGRLRAAAYATLEILNEDERVTHFVTNEVRRAGERPRLMVEEAVSSLFDLLDEGRSATAQEERISRATAEGLGGSFFAQIYTAAGKGERIRAEVVPQFLYAAVLPYLGPEAAAEELRTPPPVALDWRA